MSRGPHDKENTLLRAAARAQGLDRFLGSVCENDHEEPDGGSIRYTVTRKCVRCRQEIAKRNYAIPEQRASSRARRLKSKYGISPEHYESMLRAQAHCCGVCRQHMARPNIDHDHRTGHVRGLLCSSCNTGLGYFGDNLQGLERAQAYLQATDPAMLAPEVYL